MTMMVLLLPLWSAEVTAEVRLIGPRHLDSALALAQSKEEGRRLPDSSWLEKTASLGTGKDSSSIAARIFTPWARAARVAAAAARGAITLEAKIWNPDIYNVGVMLVVEGWRPADSGAIQIQDVVCLADGVLLEPIWQRIDTVKTITPTPSYPSLYYQALFPLELVDRALETQVFVSTDRGDTVFVFAPAELSSLR